MGVAASATHAAIFIAQADAVTTGATALDRFVTTFGRGLAQGSIYAIVALGFVLGFKATQAVNCPPMTQG